MHSGNYVIDKYSHDVIVTDKANDLFDLIEGDVLTKQREMSMLRIKTHFSKIDLQKQSAQPDIVEEDAHKQMKKRGDASLR